MKLTYDYAPDINLGDEEAEDFYRQMQEKLQTARSNDGENRRRQKRM